MQSETADFARGAATWRTRRNIRVVSDSAHSLCYAKNTTLSTKPEVGYITYRIAVRKGPSHGHR